MTKIKYTKEQRNAYFAGLREDWKKSKALADNDEEAKALYKETGGRYSYYSFFFTLQDMRKNGFEGLPYIDCKTFNGWKDAGFKVKKGEKSKIKGIVWMHPTSKDDNGETTENEDVLFPKLYHLFHTSQVEEIKK